MSYNAKNHTEQGGEKTVIGGKVVIENGAEVEIKEGAQVTGLPSSAGLKLYKHVITGGVEVTLYDFDPTPITTVYQVGTRCNKFSKAFYHANGIASNGYPIIHAYTSTNKQLFIYCSANTELSRSSEITGTTSVTDTVTEVTA